MTGTTARHPDYTDMQPEWEMMRDTHGGQRRIKLQGTRYLPPTSGMIKDGFPSGRTGTVDGHGDYTLDLSVAAHRGPPGYQAYIAYLKRAVFPDTVSEAVEAMLGMMHAKPPSIDLPAQLEPMRGHATLRGESLEMLLRRVNEQQLIYGRLGLMLDLPAAPQVGVRLPYVALYEGLDIVNWDAGRRDGIALENLNLVVLNETGHERQADFSWQEREKYRYLVLGDLEANEGRDVEAVYRQMVASDDESFAEAGLRAPVVAGQTLGEIPFVFINAKDINPRPDDPPLRALAEMSLTIYRGEADYRQSLFALGQDTLVISGASDDEAEYRLGVGAVLSPPMGAEAKFVGISSDGVPEQRAALENDYARAGQKSGEMIDTVSRERESGDALKIRVSSRTATLRNVALAGAYGLEQLLKMQARWVGADEDAVVVSPNLDFVDDTLSGQELVSYMAGKNTGAPLSARTLHDMFRERGLTSKTFEEEMTEIEEEEPMPGSTSPTGPETDDDGQQ